MKRLTVIWLFISLATFCYGQDWNCFVPGTKQYFINGEGYLKGIRIDSVKAIGSNTVYYPFHTPRGFNYDTSILDTTGGSWVGRIVTRDSNGIFYFDNLFGDTIIIKTLAHTGDYWTFYDNSSDTSGIYYKATVVEEDTLSIVGVVDSVKKITIQAYRHGSTVTDTTNNFEMTLSKFHGLVETFELFTFPYRPPNSVTYGGYDYYLDGYSAIPVYSKALTPQVMFFWQINYLIPFDSVIYNFQIGDKFRFYGYGEPFSPLRWLACVENETTIIKNKIISSAGTEYGISDYDETKCATTTPPYNDLLDTGGHVITVNGAVIADSGKMPEEWGVKNIWQYSPNDSSLCFVSPVYTIRPNGVWGNGRVGSFEYCGAYTKYKAGFGILEEYDCFAAPGGPDYTKTIIAAKKNGIDCGMGVAPVQSKERSFISIFPNPASDDAIIKFGNTRKAQVDIINVFGQVVLSATVTGNEYRFNVKDLPSGLYDVRVIDGREYWNEKLVVEH